MRALTCPPPATFDRAISTSGSASNIEVSLAQKQHTSYVEALISLGVDVIELPPDPSFPDCCFVEDQVVIVDEVALITRSARLSRRGEAEAVGSALHTEGLRTVATDAPATLDGGDVLRVGKTLFVGCGNRTNRDGVLTLEATFAPLGYSVVPIPMPAGTLHLKSVCSRLGDSILLATGTIDPDAFGPDVQIVHLPGSDSYGANVLSAAEYVADPWVLVSRGNPALESLAKERGLRLIALEMSEFRKADGALTCLSVLF